MYRHEVVGDRISKLSFQPSRIVVMWYFLSVTSPRLAVGYFWPRFSGISRVTNLMVGVSFSKPTPILTFRHPYWLYLVVPYFSCIINKVYTMRKCAKLLLTGYPAYPIYYTYCIKLLELRSCCSKHLMHSGFWLFYWKKFTQLILSINKWNFLSLRLGIR